ncbi:MAG: HNH endonuclease signature motif containing protein [Akkermansia sp.]
MSEVAETNLKEVGELKIAEQEIKESGQNYLSEIKESLTSSYLGELKELSGKDIASTIEHINVEDFAKKVEPLSTEEIKIGRAEFQSQKEALIKDWESLNQQTWPQYTHDVYDQKTGTLIRTEGSRYDAHHIQPLQLGGKNEASNLIPLSAENHYDHRGVHEASSPLSQLNKLQES